ncbi:MAG TPA: 4-hydroxy-tetrahydrodipicolinate synthase [Gammaproteobacteria bacterium]|nr:4-hydroxy-tetrahydrodipicolinate synthase [Gammaproteobacteria bacterium]MCH78599.1 4-hydroxy-tetrahydrodipicolinate synthase [Gammaproteobacteria bacterium]
MIHGSVVALVTPMTASGAVDYAALARLVEFHVEAGTHGIVAVGTTGESPTLGMDEHIGVIAEVVRRVDGRVPVIGGTGANATAEAIELTQAAADAGVDACLLVTPYYNKPTQEGLYRHFLAVAQAVTIPQILYNVPGRTACDLRTQTVLRLAEVPNIVGLKDATGSLERGAELLAACPDDFWLFSGDDAIAAELMLQGYRGVISVTANVAPQAMAAMSEAAMAGRRDQTLALDAPLQALHRDLFVEANPIPVKWALAEMELIEAGFPLPLTPLSAPHHAAVRAALRQAAVL